MIYFYEKDHKSGPYGHNYRYCRFPEKRGIYVVALALISAAALSAVLTVKQPNGADPAQTDDPASEVNTDIGDRLTDAQLPIATPTPSPTATPTPMPDFTPAPPTPKPTAVQNSARPYAER